MRQRSQNRNNLLAINNPTTLSLAYDQVVLCPPAKTTSQLKTMRNKSSSPERKENRAKKILPSLHVNEKLLERVSRNSNRMKMVQASHKSLELTKSNNSHDSKGAVAVSQQSYHFFDKASTLNVNSSRNILTADNRSSNQVIELHPDA